MKTEQKIGPDNTTENTTLNDKIVSCAQNSWFTPINYHGVTTTNANTISLFAQFIFPLKTIDDAFTKSLHLELLVTLSSVTLVFSVTNSTNTISLSLLSFPVHYEPSLLPFYFFLFFVAPY